MPPALPPDLAALRGGSAPPIPVPPRRWRTRVLLPVGIAAAVLALLAYAGREALRPALPVRVVPAVSAGEAGGEGATVAPAAPTPVQAAGWVEPDPYALTVPALAEGVVREVLVLEGDGVTAGQVVARLIDDDARLALARAESETASAEAEAGKAAADVLVAEARAAETRREVERKRPLLDSGAIPRGDVEQLDLRLAREGREVDAARAQARVMDARAATARAALAQARLAMERTEVRSPSAGVVMQRLVQPGTRVTVSGRDAGEMPTALLRLYDPARLRVRVDVPLADAAKVGVGTPAEITTEALPGRVLAGEVSRAVHEANIQRNTVQFKVRLAEPESALRPEMLARVRLRPSAPVAPHNPTPADGAPTGAGAGEGEGAVLVPRSALAPAGEGRGTAWVVEQAPRGPRAVRRAVTVAGETAGGHAVVTSGLRPGDRVILGAPAGLAEGTRVRVAGEATGEEP